MIHLYNDQFIGLVILIALVAVTSFCACLHERGFINWFKDRF